MTIIRDQFYIQELDNIVKYMAKNSIDFALEFLDLLDSKINNLTNMTYKFRQSYYHNNENVRDLIVKGYTIPYLINTSKNIIIILDIFKYKYREIK
jgi:glutaredoxin-related protein